MEHWPVIEADLWDQLPYASTLYKHKDWTFTARSILNFYSKKKLTAKWSNSIEALELLIKEYNKLILNP